MEPIAHWYVTTKINIDSVRAKAQINADRIGKPERIHYHPSDNKCNEKCEVIKPQKE